MQRPQVTQTYTNAVGYYDKEEMDAYIDHLEEHIVVLSDKSSKEVLEGVASELDAAALAVFARDAAAKDRVIKRLSDELDAKNKAIADLQTHLCNRLTAEDGDRLKEIIHEWQDKYYKEKDIWREAFEKLSRDNYRLKAIGRNRLMALGKAGQLALQATRLVKIGRGGNGTIWDFQDILSKIDLFVKEYDEEITRITEANDKIAEEMESPSWDE